MAIYSGNIVGAGFKLLGGIRFVVFLGSPLAELDGWEGTLRYERSLLLTCSMAYLAFLEMDG